MKDGDNALAVERQPGPLATMLGGRVEQFYALDTNVPLTGEWGTGEGTIWAEQLSAANAETKVLMRYGKSNGWLDGQPAAVTRQVGKGRITYIGAWMDEATMAHAAKWMVETSGVKPEWGVMPEGVDLYLREGSGKKTAILVNFGSETKSVTLPGAMTDVLAGGAVTTVTIPQYGVEVLATK